ncbi:tRNA (adenosine(37)-N6)-threonylcarbamoyltransferase complex transferase subunit TsaD [Candidatus Jorgensenbacteria bacterium]|nr:tRNA (adenosine(37)-N6)-threonylcarbamoyltransferase complex transferase subunit TsaD [Candidatus Jorgensenbacteria bacterium]
MKILAIETSCDETAIALLKATGRLNSQTNKPRFKILKNLVSSQISIHRPFGGVVPNLAKREHLKNLPIVFERIASDPYQLKPDLVAVTVGPGLEPALWTGVNFAKEIRHKYFPNIKLLGVNHLEGHLYSFLLSKKTKSSKIFPAISLIVSGGHTILLLMQSLTKTQKLGETRDDAVGEAFDKVARLLNLPYPGGPEIEKLARIGNPNAIAFPRPMIHTKDYDFSFSGLKTSVLYYLRDIQKTEPNIQSSQKFIADVAASFQQAAIDTLITKTIKAAKTFRVKSIMLSGGVAANKTLRKNLKREGERSKMNFFSSIPKFQTDNAVMIGIAAYISHLKKKNRHITAQGNLNL